LLRVLIRILGLSLFRSGVDGSVLNVDAQPWRSVLMRQVAQKRRRMGRDS
jgi:hypothetical protein